MIESWRAAAAAGDPELQHAARANLSAWLPYLPRLKAVLPFGVAPAISPDGKFVLIGDTDGRLRRWDLKTGRQNGPTFQHSQGIGSVVFSPDGTTILIGGLDGTARLWDSATGRPAGPILRHQARGDIKVAFSPDGKTLVTFCWVGGVLQLWDSATGRPIGERRRPLGLHRGFYDLPLPSQLWDAAAGRYTRPFLKIPMPRGAVALSPDGNTFVTVQSNGTLRVWDAVTGQPLTPPRKGHNDWIRFAVFSPDGATFLTGSTDKTARLWDAVTVRPIGMPLLHRYAVFRGAFSPDGKLLSTCGDGEAVRVWESQPYQSIRLVLEHASRCTAVAFSPDGKLIVTGHGDGRVRRWDATTGRSIAPALEHPQAIGSVVFSPDGKTILIGGWDGTARLWDSASGQRAGPLFRHKRQGDVKAVFSPDGNTVLTGGNDGTVRQWDAASGAQLGAPFRPAGAVLVQALGPDGKTFVAFCQGGQQLWNLATGSRVGQSYGEGEVSAFSPDGKSFLTGVIDTVNLWDVASGTLLLPPLASQSYVTCSAISGDGKVLAAGNQRVVHLWDAATGQPIGPILPHPDTVNALAFSPDGKFLLTGARDGKARLFCAAPEVPDDLDRVANWVEVLTGMTLETRQGQLHFVDHASWLASCDRLAKWGGPPVSAWDSRRASDRRPTGLEWALSQLRWDAAWEEFSLIASLSATAPPHEVAIASRQVLALGERVVAKYPAELAYQRGLALTQNNLAWLLATHPDPAFQDFALAVEIAGKAVKSDPENASYLNTLGTALYRAGDWSRAIGALRRSNERDDGHWALGHNGFFLAMAHFRRGEFTTARIWFEIADRIHHHRAAADQDLVRFHAEAARVLGLGPAADRKEEAAPADDATLATLVLQADPGAAWARTWLAHAKTGGNRAAGPPDDAAMPNGPRAFARP
jgi:WD40 repeat protein